MSLMNRVMGRIHTAGRRIRAGYGFATTRHRAHQGQGHVGDRTFIDPSVQVLGWEWVDVGQDSVLSEDCWININHREAGQKGVVIGDSCFIGRRNFFTSGERITLGDFCLTGVNCHFLGAGHVASDPMVPYLMAGVTRGGAISIGTNCWIGAACTVLAGTTIGFGSIIGAATVVKGEVPPFSLVVGNPGRVVKRFHPLRGEWVHGDGTARVDGIPTAESYRQKIGRYRLSVRDNLIAVASSFGEL